MNNENTTVPEKEQKEQKEQTEEKQEKRSQSQQPAESTDINTASQIEETDSSSFTSHLPQISTQDTNNTSSLSPRNNNNIDNQLPLTLPSPSATPTNSLSNTPNISINTNTNNSTNNSPIPSLPILNTNGHQNHNGINGALNGHNNNNVNGTKNGRNPDENDNNDHSSNTVSNHGINNFDFSAAATASPLVSTPERMNELIDQFGHPQNMSDFNIMAIAGVLQKGNHIHKNRELKATIKRYRSQMAEQQNQIKILHEKVKIYKSEAEKYERLELEYEKVKDLNKNLVAHCNTTKKDNIKLKEKLKNSQLTSMSLSQLHTNTNNASFHGILPPPNNNGTNNDEEIVDIAPLPANDDNNNDNHNNNNNNILAPNDMDIDNDNIEPLQIENDGEKEGEHRQPSSWLRNQRLIQLTGEQTYMTAHQKVIRDPNQKKSHQTYQRKDTFKSIQSENKSLKDQIVKLTKELDEARANHGGLTVDGQTAEYWKSQLSKVRDELEEQKKITTKFNLAMNSNDDGETVKIKHANLCSEHERLKIRYEKSKSRVEKLAAETEQAKKDKDRALKDKEETKEKTTKIIQTTKAHIVKISNDKEMYRKEMARFQKENKKLMQRDTMEDELKQKLEDTEKKLKHTETQCIKYKKRYKDLKVQIDTADVSVVIRNRKDRPRGRPKKNEKSIYVSTDSSEAEQIKETVDFLKELNEADKGKNNGHNDKEKKKKKKKKRKKHKKDKKKKHKHKDRNNYNKKNQEQQQQQIQPPPRQQQQIVNDVKSNNALDDNDDDIDWSDDDQEPIISQQRNNANFGAEINRNNNKKKNNIHNNIGIQPQYFPAPPTMPSSSTMPPTPTAAPEMTGMSTTIGLMSYGSASPQMLPIQDINRNLIKTELDEPDFSVNAHNTASTTISIKKSNNSNNTENDNNNNNNNNNFAPNTNTNNNNGYNFDNTVNNNNNTDNFHNNYDDNNEFDNMFDNTFDTTFDDTFDNNFNNNFQTDNNNDNDNNNDGDDEDDNSDFFDPDAIYQHHPATNNRDIIQETNATNNNQTDNAVDDDDDDDDEDDDEENSMFDMGSGISSGPSSPCQKPIPLKLSHPVPFSLATTTDPIQSNPNNTDNMDAAPLVLNDSGHSAADDSEVPNEQLLNSRHNEIDDGKPQPLFQSFDTITSDSDADHSDRSNQFQSPLQTQPEPFTALQIENDDENVDKIQDNVSNDSEDDDIIQKNPVDVKSMNKSDSTMNFNIGVKKDEDMNNNTLTNTDNISTDNISTNNKKRPREIHDNMASNMVINEPLSKKRKLDNNNNDNNLDSFDNFDSFMDANDNTSNDNTSNNNLPSTQTAPPLMNRKNNIKKELNLPNVSYKDYEQRKIERQQTNMRNMNKALTMSTDYISTQFVDWKAEFGYIITQKSDELQGSDLVSSCIHSILCRWKFANNECDATNTPKQIADGIVQIIIMDKFDILCPAPDFFKSHNKNIYLPLIGALCDIITRLNRSKNSKKNLSVEVMKLCKKIINGKLYDEIRNNRLNNTISPKIYFAAGMLSILCKVNKKDPFFWRQIISMMDDLELHIAADLLSISFECNPNQIGSYQDAFVMNCMKHIFMKHAHSMNNNNNNNDEYNEYNWIRECYQRLMNVVNGKWNYIIHCSIDDILRKQISKTIENGAMDDAITGDTESGILMICSSDIRYGINYFLPNILYPIIWQQFKYHKPKLQIFFLDLFFSAITKVYKQLKKFNESQCELVRNEIGLIMESILTLFIGSAGSVGSSTAVEPNVAVCCIRNLLRFKTNNYIQSIIHQNVNSDHQLLQFATNIFKAWKDRLNSIKIAMAEKLKEQQRFNTLMHIIHNVFKQRSYNIEAYNELKSHYYSNNTQLIKKKKSNTNINNTNNRQF